MKLNFFVSKKIQFKNENEIIGTRFTKKKNNNMFKNIKCK